VYKWDETSALVQTVDFFTPVVDDPATFGAIAAANALSDVYAMGGRPLTALAVAGFPKDDVDEATIREIFLGGLHKLREAGVVLLGGHTVQDKEIKFGYAVTGVVAPDAVWTNAGARAGDALFLTKPLGTGVIATAIKFERASPETIAVAIEVMVGLNRAAAEALMTLPAGSVHACTDITGFGFLGHACEMIEGSETGMRIFSSTVPVFEGIHDLIDEGFLPGGLYRNKNFRMPMIEVKKAVPEWLLDLLFDPQTSGGLLISVKAKEAEGLLKRMRDAGVTDAAIVGEVVKEPKARIVVE